MKNKEKGFTLIELLAVIVVLALIMIIATPSILTTMNKSKKENFYLYAVSLQSKAIAQYTQDLDFNKDRINCAIYDIKSDLDLSNTGPYDGWVKVQRQLVNSGSRVVNITLSNVKELQNVKYCIGKEECKPNESFYVKDGTTSTTITKSLKPGEYLCANYQITDDKNVLKTQERTCKNYSAGSLTNDSYDYSVSITLTNKTYSVENVLFNKEMSQEIFYQKIDEFKTSHSNLEISKPSCDGIETSEFKGTTTTSTTKITNNSTTTKGTTYVTNNTTTTKGTTYVTNNSTTTKETTYVTNNSTTTKGTTYVTNNSTTTKETTNITDSSTTTKETTSIETTTTSPKDTSLLLSNLNVSGYNIDFNSQIFLYELFVSYETTSLNVTAIPLNSTSQVFISNNNNLKVGINVIVIEIFDTLTGKRGYYRINVTRYDKNENISNSTKSTSTTTYHQEEGLPDPTLEESDATLKYLTIPGYIFDFRSDTYEYTLETRGEDTIYPIYETSAQRAMVSVSGCDNISDGSQVIIFVKSPNGFYNKTYTINIREKKKDSTSTKVIRSVSIGLGALLIAIIIVLGISKKNKKIIRNKQEELNDPTRQSTNVVAPTPMENNTTKNVFDTPDDTNNNNTDNQNVFDQNSNNGNFYQ